MGKIHKLSPILADMIAAGEVVERPASVIKELVENAIDAGAKTITVEIKNGGVTFMRVTDDGSGISREDAPTAFLRHATSKIRTQEDLSAIGTMGFRGEALAAISAVSKIDLLTRTPACSLGTTLRVEAGNVLEVSDAGCPVGTTIIVRDLFYNTPARMKFLKRDSVEGSYISGAVQRQALGHPEIAFRFIKDGKQELSTPGDGRLISAIYAAMGRMAAMDMVEIKSSASGVSLSGYVGKPTANRGSRSYQHFFVNGRYVKSGMMTAALEEAYKNQMMVGRFPMCVLHVTVPPAAVDVNVHPAKTEVKFLREGDVFDAIRYGVLGALSRTPDKPEMTVKPAPQPAKPVRTPVSIPQKQQEFFKKVSAQEYKAMTGMLEKGASAQPSREFRLSSLQKPAGSGDQVALRDSFTPITPEIRRHNPPEPVKAETPVPAPIPAPPEPAQPPVQTNLPMPEQEIPKAPPEPEIQEPKETIPYRIIGQTMDTYIIVEQGDGLLFFDKHAAHERILFEKLKKEKHEVMSQVLLSPMTPALSREEAAVLLSNLDTLSALGFTLEDFGGDSLVVRAIPADLLETEAESCLQELAENLMEGKKLDPETVFDELLHTVACKAAIKGGRKTDPQELSALVKELMSREDIKYCPHGRPVCISLTKKNLEKQFKRT